MRSKFLPISLITVILFSLFTPALAKPISAAVAIPEEEMIAETEPNDTLASANSLPMTTDKIIKAGASSSDVDFYKFTVTEADAYAVVGISEVETIDLKLALFDGNGGEIKPLASILATGLVYNVFDLQAGTYYVKCTNAHTTSVAEEYFVAALSYTDLLAELDLEAPAAPKVNTIDDNDKVITGATEPNATIYIDINGDELDEDGILADSKGNFKYPIRAQKAGTKVEVYAEDEFGNLSDATKKTVIDKTPPQTLTVSKLTVKSKTITGKTEPNATIKVMYTSFTMGTAKADSKGNYKVTLKSTPCKDRIYKVTATDKAGNAKTVKTKVLTK